MGDNHVEMDDPRLAVRSLCLWPAGEQAARLERFLAAHDQPRYADAKSAVRSAAKDALAALLRRPIEFDVNAPPEARAAAADRLFGQVREPLPATRPTTRPAATGGGLAN